MVMIGAGPGWNADELGWQSQHLYAEYEAYVLNNSSHKTCCKKKYNIMFTFCKPVYLISKCGYVTQQILETDRVK